MLVPSGELGYWRSDTPKGASEVLPGITRVPLPGHTTDHSGYRIVSGKDRILIWTDIVHLPGIQFPRSEATVAFDVDPHQAATARRRIMAELAESGELVGGHHLDFPGLGYVVEGGDEFRFLPHVWRLWPRVADHCSFRGNSSLV